MIPYSNTTPQSWSEFAAWLRGLKLDGVLIEHNAERDEVIIRNSKTMTVQRVSRFALEHMDPALRQEIFLQTIANTMKNPQGGMVTSGVATQGMISGGTGPVGFGSIMRGAMGAPAYVDEYYTEQVQKDVLAKKMFTESERLHIMEVKHSIRSHIEKHMPTHQFDMSSVVIAGGCFASMLNREVVKDFDVFLLDNNRNRGALNSLEAEQIRIDASMVKVNGEEYIKNDKIEKTVALGHNALQYISTKYKTRKELIDHFDFKHCCVSYDYANDKMFMSREVFNLIKNKTLRPNSDKTPEYWRYQKFFDRGWKSEIAFA